MNIPCPTKVTCPCTEDPFANLSAEAADSRQYIALYDAVIIPRLNQPFDELGTKTFYTGGVNTRDSRDGANRGGWTETTEGRGGTTYPNSEQVCCNTCPDGSSYCYTLPAGTIYAASQDEADALAQSVACSRARQDRICFPATPDAGCVDTLYAFDFACTSPTSPTEAAPWVFSVASGSLPPGIDLVPIGGSSSHCLLIGTPTVPGLYYFTIQVTRADGTGYAQKAVTLSILAIDQTVLADGAVGTPYSVQFTATGGIGPYLYTLALGSLPDGLTLTDDGLLSGTPTTAETAPFTIMIEDLG
jgi:hypothetical protein